MGLYVITGATTGIGAATKAILEGQGHRVINIDIIDGDITADLAVKKERERAISQMMNIASDGLDGFISCAGVGPTEPGERVMSLNFFAAKEITEAAFALLQKKGGCALVVSSNSANMSGLNTELVDIMCEENNEEKAAEYGKKFVGLEKQQAYQGSKFAIARWVRRISAKWAARGVRINAIAPGATMTPLMEKGLQDESFKTGMENYPIPTQYGKKDNFLIPKQIANCMVFMMSEDADCLNGAVLYADGGTDAILRTERF